ncbi:MAG TPA: ABC transporter ATP-binding protein [Tetrasphaera sp.]|jgi:teichoic acid transport system ATP-binding protein|uniref:ABC transporter ATP-binding protein n=1 Tax=Nostocoides vanveenii TaxID=330835 RepID=A0ABN2KWK5_9MICO|nr:ABC transporter ATP-binding protein [Tetrasphaera sp.]HNQ07697.1 ABC transporter ATP-binding protein [Tetrasphaera sp.]
MAAPEPPGTDSASAAASERRPSVIVSGVDVTYRVQGAKKAVASVEEDDESLFRGLFRRGRDLATMQTVEAVKDVSFVAYHGESIGIIGRNGSGKSTLLRAIAGLIPPTKGQIWISGEPSLLGVNAVLMSKLTGERNIYVGGQALGLSRAQVRARFEDIVEFSGIGEAVHRPMQTYSSGQAARLRFAISTAAAPDILMIDEALATGDADFKERSAARVAEIREQASTVFLVSHSNATVRDLCNRALWMEKGVLLADGPAEEVVAAYEATLPKKKPPAKPKTPPSAPSPTIPPAPKDA